MRPASLLSKKQKSNSNNINGEMEKGFYMKIKCRNRIYLLKSVFRCCKRDFRGCLPTCSAGREKSLERIIHWGKFFMAYDSGYSNCRDRSPEEELPLEYPSGPSGALLNRWGVVFRYRLTCSRLYFRWA